jgi:phosphatidylglycerophosphatase A
MRWERLAGSIATVGGLGRIPWAPGTWGSAVGVLLAVLTSRTVSQPFSILLLVATFIMCARICTSAEQQLGQHDPAVVILDEVWGMASVTVTLPWTVSSFPLFLAALLLFRVFDITKPPPLKRLASLRAGWGIMADDLGAAVYTVLVLSFIASMSDFGF